MRVRTIMLAAVAVCSTIALAEPSEKGRPAPGAAATGGTIQIAPGQAGGLHITPMAGSMRVMKQIGDNGMTTVISEDDKEYTITENDDGGIRVIVKEPNVDEREFSAKDAESLKTESPEAYEIYEKYCGIENKRIMVVGSPIGGGQNFEISLNGGRLESLAARAEFMPHPALAAQLGEGVAIMNVSPDGRGEKLGLKQFDYVKSVNGTAVNNAESLDEAVKAADKLSLEVVRGGEKITLSE